VIWCGGLFVWICIEVIVVRVKVSKGFEPVSLPVGIDSADNGEISIDKSHLLPNNPARQ
jgi:hypothetical protein